MKNKRVFYVVYSQDKGSQKALDAIRLLAEPAEKNRAHITLRGPYSQRMHLPAASQAVKGASVSVNGIGTFFGPNQNTVYMVCDASGLRTAWYKPHFREVRPHLTIYDGGSREFAEQLASTLAKHTPHFRFPASELQPLAPTKGQGDIELPSSYDEAFVKDVTGVEAPLELVQKLSANERIAIISRLVEYLNSREPSNDHEKIG